VSHFQERFLAVTIIDLLKDKKHKILVVNIRLSTVYILLN